jgi:hypothetical protein
MIYEDIMISNLINQIEDLKRMIQKLSEQIISLTKGGESGGKK